MARALEILQKYWGYHQFRIPQEEIIDSILQGRDTLAILPTAAGKSICFQVPALLKEGICLVVSPLVALIQEQVNALISKNIKAVALTGNIHSQDLERILNNGMYNAYKFLYLSPERLQNTLVQQKIKTLNISLIAIDEAHCISHWGKDFRPGYLNCQHLRDWFPTTPIIALTASATSDIQEDIIKYLQLNQVNIIKKTLQKKNLAYMVYEVDDKFSRLERILTKNKESSIIYVRNRKLTLELCKYLTDKGYSATYFHGGLSNQEKQTHMNLWLSNKVQAIVATNAFGMGIDKPNVRTVIHWELPPSIEDYFQEAGRAGRDGKKAYAVTLYHQNDLNKLIYNSERNQIRVDYLKSLYKKLCNYFYIAMGEGADSTHVFVFSDFVSRFALDTFEVYQALEVLERNGVIMLSKSFHRKAQVQIKATSSQIQEYLKRYPQQKDLIYFLIRKYTGIYTQSIDFQIDKISSIIEQTPEVISKQLETLHRHQIIEYRSENTDAEITFLMPRDDDRTINYIAPQVKKLNQIKKEQANAIADYICNNNQCKEHYLIRYFGEVSTTPCGICSFCIEQKNKTQSTDYQENILHFLKNNPATSQQICQKFLLSETEILLLLQKLLDQRKIYKNAMNEYTYI